MMYTYQRHGALVACLPCDRVPIDVLSVKGNPGLHRRNMLLHGDRTEINPPPGSVSVFLVRMLVLITINIICSPEVDNPITFIVAPSLSHLD